MQTEPTQAEVSEVEVEEETPTLEDISFEKFEKLQKWAANSIPGLGKAKSKPLLDPEELVPGPCDCEHTNHGLHWKPARRTPEWEEMLELAKEDDGEERI